MSDKLIRKIIEYGIPAVLITPLLIGESLVFPMITTKAFFFYILVDILLICYLLLLKSEALYPRKSKLLYFFIGMTLLTFVIDLFGINSKQSFWGNYERMVGIYTSIHFLIYIWILLSFYGTKKKFEKLLDVSVVVSVLVGVYGFLQKIGVDWWGIIDMRDDRLQSTLGNAAFLGGYALIHLFIVFYLFFKKDKNKYWKGCYVLAFVTNLAMLYFSGTRGSLLGLAVAVFGMLGFLALFHAEKKVKRASVGLLFISILMVSSLFVFKDSSVVQSSAVLRRVSESSLTSGTGYSRLLLWGMSIEASKDRVLFGYGTNNMRIPLDKYHDYNLDEDWFDSAHNKFFDELLAHGIIGLILYLAFLFLVLRQVVRLRKKDFVLSIALFGLFVGYIVQSLLIFDSFVIGLLFVFVLSWLFVSEESEDFVFKKIIKTPVAYLLCIVIGFGALLVYLRAIPPARDVITAYRIIPEDFDTAMELYEKIENQIFFSYDIISPTMAETGLAVFSRAEKYSREDLEKYVAVVARMYEKAIEESNDYSKFYINLAKLYQRFDMTLDAGYLEKSFELLDKAREVSPGRIDIYYVEAQGHFNLGDTEKSIEILYEALELGVHEKDVYLQLLEIQVRRGEVEGFIGTMDALYGVGSKVVEEKLDEFAKILVERQEWEGVLAVFLKVHEARPKDIDNHYNIALTYKKIGDREGAEEWAHKVIDINPFKADEMNLFILSL